MSNVLGDKFKEFKIDPSPDVRAQTSKQLDSSEINVLFRRLYIYKLLFILNSIIIIVLSILFLGNHGKLMPYRLDVASLKNSSVVPGKENNKQADLSGLVLSKGKSGKSVDREQSLYSNQSREKALGITGVNEPATIFLSEKKGRSSQNEKIIKKADLSFVRIEPWSYELGLSAEIPDNFIKRLNIYPERRRGIKFISCQYSQPIFLTSKNLLNFNTKEGIYSSSEEFMEYKGADVIVGNISGHWTFSTGLSYQQAKSKIILNSMNYVKEMDVKIRYDSIGYTFNAIDSFFEVKYSEVPETSYVDTRKDTSFNTIRKYNSISIPFLIGYKYSFSRFSLTAQAGLVANIAFASDLKLGIDETTYQGLTSNLFQLSWGFRVQPELSLAINENILVSTGLSVTYRLSEYKNATMILNENKYKWFSGLTYLF